jgi:hypothetical protein
MCGYTNLLLTTHSRDRQSWHYPSTTNTYVRTLRHARVHTHTPDYPWENTQSMYNPLWSRLHRPIHYSAHGGGG